MTHVAFTSLLHLVFLLNFIAAQRAGNASDDQ